MNCYYHPDRDAVGACVNCGRFICAECKVELGDKIYCNRCADKIYTGLSTLPKSMELNWFQRHLNWTYVLGLGATFVLSFIAGVVLYLTDPYATDETAELLGYLIGFLVMLPLSIWVLKRKNRSLWWLLLSGWFSPLWLGNNSN